MTPTVDKKMNVKTIERAQEMTRNLIANLVSVLIGILNTLVNSLGKCFWVGRRGVDDDIHWWIRLDCLS